MQERFTIEIDKIKERHGDRKKRRGTAVFEIAKREHVEVFVSCQKLIPVNILILGLQTIARNLFVIQSFHLFIFW